MAVIRVFVILAVAVAFAPLAAAQSDAKWHLRNAVLENDDVFPVFSGEPSDRFYTHGVQVTFGKRTVADGAGPVTLPAWTRFAARRCGACLIYPTFSVGQQAYTPELIESPDPQPGEHPWAGWLYGAVGATVDTPGGGRHEYQLRLGVTGDSTGVRQLQEVWHRVINRPQAQGWDNQLGSDVGINAYYRFRTIWRRSAADSRVHWDLGPTVEAAIGTMRTHASFGGIARIGPHIGDALEAPNEGPVEPPLWPVQFNKVKIYGFLGASIRAVGYDYFLEGSLFHDDPYIVERENIVREIVVGVSAHYKGWAMSYSIHRRSGNFVRLVGESGARHSYGSLVIRRGF